MRSKIPFLLLALIALVIALATVLEHNAGTRVAMTWVYGAWWFKVLWGVMTLAALYLIYKKRLWHNRQTFCLHVAFVVILVGALTTSLTSRRGFVSVREGETAMHYMVPEEDNDQVMRLVPLPFYLRLDSFRVEVDEDGVTHSDYVSYVKFIQKADEEKATISMNKIGRCQGFRIFQTSYDDDLHGSTFTVSYDPWGTGITYAGYLMLAVAMLFAKRNQTKSSAQKPMTKNSSFSVFSYQSALWLLAILLSSYMVIAIAFRPLMPVLRSPMLFIHVGTIMVSYILLIVSILKRNLLKVAVFFLAAGIFLGAMWANISWGSYWSWDPKESWALVTLIVCSIPLHQKSLPWFRSDKHYRLYCVLCLLCLLMTYFGVNYLLGGMHSYAN